ncbi:cAMP responsive element binding protein 3-like 3 like isoform X1 [Conger conger]|uniref:cAMP responsive element binding protein 3-like 3 like isoform X1 n=1 Tax=Conger conger TaxID=82655 RepID=UPI002A5A4121|nr:cAMP responsive element binding protein 3-like 3 like isoform X1 [Conger conger]XP_061117198.1 cAMP responsive element binding protein 3-like 3 like isoform X1 [Conger conger]
MSVVDQFPEMDADLLGLLFQAESVGADDPFFADGSELMERLFSEQDMFGAVDPEDFLSSLLGEEESVPCQSHSPLGSDSGISDDSGPSPALSPGASDSGPNNACLSPGASDSEPAPSPAPSPALLPDVQWEAAETVQTDHCYSLQQQGDEHALLSVRAERPDTDVFIDLEDWDSMDVMEDRSDQFEDVPPCTLAIEEAQSSSPSQFQFQEIVLTEEERRLLAKEGSTLPSHLPLTKAEERTLKRVRRKIRNKQSAQESRKKKRVYVDGLENRVAVCTAHNLELQKKVHLLQKENMTLVEQLRKLQALMKLSTLKTSTTGTCVMVFLLSFCLIIFPSFNPFGSSGGQKELYPPPKGVLSRALRSVSKSGPVEGVSPKEWSKDEEPLLLATVENGQAVFSANQNHTPDYQHVERPDSESGVNSNSSSDFPGPAGADAKPGAGAPGGAEGPRAGPVGKVDYQVAGSNENWIDRKPTTVIIQQHRSDEM